MLNVNGYNINFDGLSKTENGVDIASFFATHYVGEDALNLTIRGENLESLKTNFNIWSKDFIDFVTHILDENKEIPEVEIPEEV